ncbi:SusD/RagB family nutrient-binding outer membrane lipoprotein [Cyclobacterium jeungdonense]|uniref:SusD/RagB family nutrient-binding outer membrane lipoprotein n=1 Tax=Cyclobacterium jeungdonense TaxID=708087 RepID=A0ABT8C6U8_9BACT|nr:SusD/RagB family nutrient-binding outer membrane lipoprotein [Cyclobacterium jeungdonense]MDN3687528.1 SusD/RagB family nutrient-binding outer membrane lipoprotein [Cyclobacterium jeungdonense]
MKSIYNLILGALLLFGASACENFLDVNENPNNPQDAPISGLMTNATYETALNVQRIGSITSNYVQYLASPNPASSSDVMDPLNYSGTWFNLYNVMTDLTDLISKAEESDAGHYLGAGQVLMALNLGMTVDIFGDVPYSEGFDFSAVTPTYDDDEQLYGEILSLLDRGIQNLSGPTAISIGDDDFIFQGDVDSWLKFANMLKGRFMLHTKDTGSYNETELLSALDNGFSGNEDDAAVAFFDQRFNPWAQVAINNENLLLGGWISTQFVEALDGTSYPTVDPRLPLMIGTTDDGEFIGVPNGAGRGDAPEQGARSTLIPGQFYTSELSPLLIATYAEQKFIEAEAALMSDPNRAYAAYLEGIEAHMDMLEVAESEKEAYLSDPSVSVGAGSLTLDAILKEKWVALFLHPETWNDARRFDYGYKDMTLPANLNSNLNNQFIRRLAYPDNEVSRNGENVPDVTLLDRIWWDQ